jgi:hypothetical protein
MLRHITIAIAVLGALSSASAATAGTAGSDYGGQLVGTVTSVDRAQNLLVLDNFTVLRGTDQRMLASLRDGERVKVDFVVQNGTKLIQEIGPAASDATSGVTPTTEGGTKTH